MEKIAHKLTWLRWWPLVLFCVLSGSRWMLSATLPQTASSLASSAIGCGALAAVLALVAYRFKSWVGLRLGAMVRLALCGVGVLSASAVGALLRGAAGESIDRTVAFCFVPLLVWIALRAFGDDEGAHAPLWFALAGIAGALTIFPLEMPATIAQYAGLLLPVSVCALAAVTAVRFSARKTSTDAAALLFGGGTGFAVLVLIGHTQQIEMHLSGLAVLLDAITAGAGVLTLMRLGAMRFAACFLLAPVLTILEGAIIERPQLEAHLIIGILLLAAGGLLLLREAEQQRVMRIAE